MESKTGRFRKLPKKGFPTLEFDKLYIKKVV